MNRQKLIGNGLIVLGLAVIGLFSDRNVSFWRDWVWLVGSFLAVWGAVLSAMGEIKKESVKEVTDATFEETVLKSSSLVLVDFWAPRCQPCLALAPTFEKEAEKFAGKVKFLKLNIDENRESAERYNVRSIPTLILFRNGQEIVRSIGLGTTTARFFEKHLPAIVENF